MDRDQAVTKLKDLIAKIDSCDATVDGAILAVATWIVDKPWTARAALFAAIICVGYTAWVVIL